MVAQAVEQTEIVTTAPAKKKDRPVPFGGSKYAYVFHANVPGDKIWVDYPGERAFDPDDDPQRRREARLIVQEWERRWPNEKDREVLKAAFYASTNGYIKFNKISESITAKLVRSHGVFETNDENLAQVVRWAIQQGKLLGVKEIDQSKVWRVGDREFANNELGKRAAEKYHDDIGASGMSLGKRSA